MLKYIGSNIEFKPTIYVFLGFCYVFDREETEWALTLDQYDPDDPDDRHFLAIASVLYCSLDGAEYHYRYKYVCCQILKDALENPNYDFSSLFGPHYYDDDDDIYKYPNWDIKEPRLFFEEIYTVAQQLWKKELAKAALEDPSTW